VVPDVLGDAAIPFPPPATFDLDAWCANTMPRPATVDPLYAAVIAHLRAEMGITRIGGVGYCFGAKYVCRFLSLPSPSPSPSPSLSAASSYPPSPSPALDAGFIAHPSFVTASEVERVAAPLSIAAAQHDDIFPADKRRETEDILAQLPGVPYQITLYSHVEHGFATKGDLAGERARWAKERAFAQAVEWLDEFVRKE
jgi:dienelactone hydrolase